jgi:hypothetical protein
MAKEKLIGWALTLAFIVIGFGGTVLNWQMIIEESKYYPKMAFIGPFIGFVGLAMLVGAPSKPADVQEDEAVTRRRTLRQRLALATVLLGLIAGGVNLALMSGWIGGLVE